MVPKGVLSGGVYSGGGPTKGRLVAAPDTSGLILFVTAKLTTDMWKPLPGCSLLFSTRVRFIMILTGKKQPTKFTWRPRKDVMSEACSRGLLARSTTSRGPLAGEAPPVTSLAGKLFGWSPPFYPLPPLIFAPPSPRKEKGQVKGSQCSRSIG